MIVLDLPAPPSVNRTRRVDFALFMVDALTDEELIREAPAISHAVTAPAI